MNKALITGGGGFVGRAVVEALLAKGVSCRIIARNSYPEIEQKGVECYQGDIRDLDFLLSAARDVDVVFHVAALAGIWGKWSDYYSINVQGTENVIEACVNNGIEHLVYTSTPSVVFDRDDICDGDESLPYPDRFLCHYAKSKVMAEKMVLQSSTRGVNSCALRPHLIWGPGDPHLIPRIIERGKKGMLKCVGDGNNLVDISYIDNVAHAHILAAENLSGEKNCVGKAYFISQGEPVNLWGWVNELFKHLNMEPVKKNVTFNMAYGIGALLESLYKILNSNNEPRMTRFLAEQLAKSHYFSIERARKDLGYEPLVSTEQGMKHLIQWLEAHEKNSH